MPAQTISEDESLGIFEVDEHDIVVYSNLEKSNGWVGSEKDLQGRNFFDEVLAFTNVADLKHHFEVFRATAIAAHSFDFNCHFQHQSVPIRVFFARISDRLDGPSTSVLVHLRRRSAASASASTRT